MLIILLSAVCCFASVYADPVASSGEFIIPTTFVSEEIKGPEDSCGYEIAVTYPYDYHTMRTLLDSADFCSQTITVRSKEVSSRDLCWVDQIGESRDFYSWINEEPACHQSGDDCLETLVVDDKNLLPVTKLRLGDTGHAVEFIYGESVSDIACSFDNWISIPAEFTSELVEGVEDGCGYSIPVSYPLDLPAIAHTMSMSHLCLQNVAVTSTRVSMYDTCYLTGDTTGMGLEPIEFNFHVEGGRTCHQSSEECTQQVLNINKSPVVELRLGDTGAVGETVSAQYVGPIYCQPALPLLPPPIIFRAALLEDFLTGQEETCGYTIPIQYEVEINDIVVAIQDILRSGAAICYQTITMNSVQVSSKDQCWVDVNGRLHNLDLETPVPLKCHQSVDYCTEIVTITDSLQLPLTQLAMGDTGADIEEIRSVAVSDLVCEFLPVHINHS